MWFGWSRPQGTKGISRPRKTTAVRSGKDLASARWAIIWRVLEKRARRIGGVRAQFGWWLHQHALGKPRAVGSSCFVQKCMFCCCAQLAWQWKMLLSESYSYDQKKQEMMMKPQILFHYPGNKYSVISKPQISSITLEITNSKH